MLKKTFGRQIAALLKRLGIFQEELGFRAGIHRTYVSQLERGMKSPTLGVILKLAQTLGLSATKLISAVERKTRHDR